MALNKRSIEPSNEFMKKMSLSNKMIHGGRRGNKEDSLRKPKSKSIFSKIKEADESE